MDRLKLSLSVFVLFFLVASASSDGNEGDDDLVIRQVVGGGAEPKAPSPEDQFSLFKKKYGKVYPSSEEHDYRFSVFKSNLRLARRHQKLDPSARHGVTQFSDLTPSEFEKKHLGIRGGFKLPKDAKKAPILPTENLPEEFDWRDRGAVTPVKNQGSCASGWSFSAAGALEGANFLANGKLVSLSEQQLIDCDHECDPEEAGSCDSGCHGGLMNSAFEYTLKTGGLMREEDYPYTGKDGPVCKLDKSKIVASISNFSVISADDGQIAAILVKNGPVAVRRYADYMQTYTGGVSCPEVCTKRWLNHGVLLVGYGVREGVPVWKIKNSWGDWWGEGGYLYTCRGSNLCTVGTLFSTVTATDWSIIPRTTTPHNEFAH